MAAFVPQNAGDNAARKPVPPRKGDEARALFVEAIEALLRADPHGACLIEIDRVHAVVTQRMRIADLVLIQPKAPRARIETQKPGRFCSEPNDPSAVFDLAQVVRLNALYICSVRG